jgi:serine/threonine protein kinase
MQPTWDLATTVYGAPPRRAKAKSTLPLLQSKDDGFGLGRHKVIGMIAAGGMGGVYLAQEPDGERVALKVLDPAFASNKEMVQRLAHEREVSARVPHAGLPRIHEFVKNPGGAPYLVMELLDGDCLGKLLEDYGTLELGAIAAIGAQVAEALAALHGCNIVHCDVKPDNIMLLHESGLGGWPFVKLVDLGVARSAGTSDELSIAGTPTYMAPEQWRGEALPACDIYSLGCMLYELLTGDPPFLGTLPELATAHMSELPARLRKTRSWVPQNLDWMIARMLAKDPGLRPKATEVAQVLSTIALAFPPDVAADENDDIDKVIISLDAVA